MKRILLLSLLLGALQCCKDKEDDNNPELRTFEVQVINGYGSGRYSPGDTVWYWSQTPSLGSVFDQWTANDQITGDVAEWNSYFIMPSKNLTATAAFKPAPAWSAESRTIQGANSLKNVYYHFPQSYKGLILLHHGTDGSAENWTEWSVEYRAFCEDAVSQGYAILATEAEEVTLGDMNGDGNKRWSYLPLSIENVDIKNEKLILEKLISDGILKSDTPLFFAGMSNGAAFASCASYVLKGQGFNVKGCALYCAQGPQLVFASTTVPSIFCMAKFDTQESVDNAQAKANHQRLLSRSISSAYYEHPPSPVYPERFARITGIDEDLSTQIFEELKENNYFNEKNFASRLMEYPLDKQKSPITSTLTLAQQRLINDQLAICMAEHKFYSDYNKKTLQFFEQQ